MKKIKLFLVLAFGATLLSSCGYNSMVEKSEMVEKQWAQVETQYQRRADLIPNLIGVVKGAANYEKETLTAVIEARSKATSIQISADELTPANMAKFQAAQSQLSGALSKLLVSVERYPDLKANKNFMELQAQLEGTENRISTSRKRFNDAVGDYNTYIKKIPQNWYAGSFGFEKKGYFEADKGTEKAPTVSFE